MTQASLYYSNCEPIAVVGMTCRFPSAPDCDAFWLNLTQGKECNRRLSRQELIEAGVSHATIDSSDFVNIAAPLEDADQFDAGIFGYSRQEAETLDPQQRIFLQCVWHALEDAGYAPRQATHKTGVFGAARISTYGGRQQIHPAEIARARGMQALLGNDKDYLATRVAYKLNLTGPALTVQTACSSSLVAVHLACESLRSGECSVAVAGGIGISFPQHTGYIYQPGMIFSPDGHCRPFDAQANGTFGGNGVGVITLRRLEDALADKDPILAVIRGSAINNDGNRKVGYTAPSVAGQREVILEALAMADVAIDEIGMVEAHGTATSLGDPIEVEALRSIFADHSSRCALGSVKGNIGHLDTAAGIASLIKAILAVHHGVIPPTLHFRHPNPLLHLENSPFFVPASSQKWWASLRTAGVSSFGIGGTNCHVIIQSLPNEFQQQEKTIEPSKGGVLLLSAASENSLRRLAGSYAEALKGPRSTDIAHTALHGRQLDLPHRLSVVLSEETSAALATFADGATDPLLHHGVAHDRKIAWLFTGVGSEWAGMGKELYARSSAFASAIDECDMACKRELQASLKELMFGNHTDLLSRIDHALPAIVAFEIAMAAHWRSLGLKPDLVIGHSLGEYAAAAVAGYYTPAQMISLAVSGSRILMTCEGGAMLAAVGDEPALIALATQHGADLAALNGPRHFVFSGTREKIDALGKTLRELRIRTRLLPVPSAAHSALVEPILDQYRFHTESIQAVDGHTLMISSLHGEAVDAHTLNTTDFWCRHLRNPVRYRAAQERIFSEGVTICLEMGPDANLTDIGERDASNSALWIPTSRRIQPQELVLEQAAMRLFASGVDLSWKEIFNLRGQRTHAPLYPFDEQRYWSQPEEAEVRDHPLCSEDQGIVHGRRVATEATSTLDIPRLRDFTEVITQLHNIYVDALVRKSVGSRIDEGVSALEILRGGRLLPRYRQLLTRLLHACVADGYYTQTDGQYRSLRPILHDDLPTLLHRLRDNSEGLDVIPEIVARAGENLHEMLSGRVEPVSILFPSGQSDGVEVLYRDFSTGRYFNQIAAGVVSGLMQSSESKPRRILEVGGGTGSTTASLLPQLAGHSGLEYHFTDISTLFTRRAEEKFKQYPFVRYREFDLEAPLSEQGLAPGSYDLIIAANVIHATQHIGRSLESLRSLLRSGGRLLMREITQPVRLFDFVFGALVSPLHDEEARGGQLFLSTRLWEEHCKDAGFEKIEWLPDDGSDAATLGEHILLATIAKTPVSLSVLSWIVDTATVLGSSIAGGDTYIADWSDCLGHHTDLIERIRHACAEISLRHGTNGMVLHPGPVRVTSDSLSEVRLRWIGGLFGWARVDIAARTSTGEWQTICQPTLSAANETNILSPAPQRAEGTHYTWRWKPISPTENRSVSIAVSPNGLSKGVIEQLNIAGIKVHPEAQKQILILPDTEPLTLAQQVLDILAENPDRALIVITQGAWALSATEAASPSHRAVSGLLRVIASEDRRRSISVIDMQSSADPNDWATALMTEDAGEHWLAVREGIAYRPLLESIEKETPPLPAGGFASQGWHVVTGGFGGLGRVAIAWMARHGARHIAILAPRPHADQERFFLEMREEFHCELRWLSCDVSDLEQLSTSLYILNQEGGVQGVIHAAGILDDAPHSVLDAARLKAVFSIKAASAKFLLDWLNTHHGRYLLLYSSAAAALGASGQSAHALACGYLDGLACNSASQKRADSTLTCISIAWGAWGETGRAADPALLAKLSRVGMSTLSTAEGIWHLEQAVMAASPYRLAMRIDAGASEELTSGASTHLAVSSGKETRSSRDKDGANTPLTHEKTVLWLTSRIAEQLRLSDITQLTPHEDLLQFGLDSLLFLELSSAIHDTLNIRIDAERAYRNMTIQGLADLLMESASANVKAPPILAATHDEDHRFDPFPLTPIQHAYWLGRTNLLEYGGVACHVLFEWDKTHTEFEILRFQKAWNALIARHDMLRMIVGDDGTQRILQQVPTYSFPSTDLRHLSASERILQLQKIREKMSYRVLRADQWPMFEVAVTYVDEDRYRVHMNLDLLQFDTQSFKIMMDDLATAYAAEPLKPLTFTFRDYVLKALAERKSDSWQRSWFYWMEILPDLPAAPALPLATEILTGQPHFTTYQARLDLDAWSQLKQEWRRWGVTPSAGLLTLFALVLERWSRQPSFTLNLTFFDRRQYHPEVQEIIGDFTSVLLLDFEMLKGSSLRKHIEQTQARLWERLAHSQVNGVEVLRELGRKKGLSSRPTMPVVFTSMLGMSLDGKAINQALGSFLGDPAYMFTQTPQVWLDHQVMEIENELIFNWFSMDGVLEEGIVQTMFSEYTSLLQDLSSNPGLLFEPDFWSAYSDISETSVTVRPSHPVPNLGEIQVDARLLEDTLRSHPAVRHAQVDAETSGGGLQLDASVVAWDVDTPSSNLDRSVIDTSRIHLLADMAFNEVESTWEALEANALYGISQTFQRHNIFAEDRRGWSFEDICRDLQALPKYHRLLHQWLDLLEQQGWVSRDGSRFTCLRAQGDVPVPASTFPDTDWSRSLMEYLRASVAQHDALLRGDRSPLELLFDNHGSAAKSLYDGNPIMQCLNGVLSEIAIQLSHETGGLRVLEIGGGTAATTRYLIPALAPHLTTYHFTDVSTLFLDEARAEFAAYSQLQCSLLNINEPIEFDRHPVQGYDLIVAVNVLHDASHVVRTLRRLGRLLSPTGHLLMIEATERESAFQMATVGFIEGINGFEDFRTFDNRAMLDLPMWRNVLDQASFTTDLVWPPETAPSMRQHLILAHSRSGGRLNLFDLETYLRHEVPAFSTPMRIHQCESLPQKPTAKPQSLKVSSTSPDPEPAETEDQRHLEAEVMSVWQSLLPQQRIDRESDFFQSGGDSLIGTRMIAMLARKGFTQASLQNLFENPQLVDFCQNLESPKSVEPDNPILLSSGRSPDAVYFFHTADGELSVYLPLARELECQAFGLHALHADTVDSMADLARHHVEAIRKHRKAKSPHVLIGWSYGSFVAAEAARQLESAGEPVRLILLDPVCGGDFRYDDRTGLFRLLANGHTRLALPADFEKFSPEEQWNVFTTQALESGLLACGMSRTQALEWLNRVDHLFKLLAFQGNPASVSVPCLRVAVSKRPPRWRPVEAEWDFHSATTQLRLIDADHWQMMNSDLHVKQTADVLKHWLMDEGLLNEQN